MLPACTLKLLVSNVQNPKTQQKGHSKRKLTSTFLLILQWNFKLPNCASASLCNGVYKFEVKLCD